MFYNTNKVFIINISWWGLGMKEKEFYREQIIEMVEKIKSTDILIYLYKITDDIIKEDENK